METDEWLNLRQFIFKKSNKQKGILEWHINILGIMVRRVTGVDN